MDIDQDNITNCRRYHGRDLRSAIEKQLRDHFHCKDTDQMIHEGWNLSLTKRVIDASIALLVLLILSPLLIIIALAVKITSPGPVFFAQNRTGYLGRRFKMYKFRTMVQNAEELKKELAHLSHHDISSPDFKVKKDPRITPVGNFLRKYSLDELPQFYNVLKGNMRLVGPRPTSFPANDYQTDHLVRLAAHPGLTGIWQISGRSDIDFDGRVELDYEYIRQQGPIQDLKILILTPLAVLKAGGAY
ncbi:MAG: sugar transferase [Gammaproteobacteria bacterium]|nr:MAG: sugar transferase [Gammaproteobacteria bacterium]